ncbi:hypothetical protein_gp169 [Bacillus phage vB_BceM_WH1]|nr:hypothetical protein_gp169 [Bacillus phage vB_BceM_WH1]
MKKLIIVAMSTLLLVACAANTKEIESSEPAHENVVAGAIVKDKETLGIKSHWYTITFTKNGSDFTLDATEKQHDFVSKGAKVKVTYGDDYKIKRLFIEP